MEEPTDRRPPQTLRTPRQERNFRRLALVSDSASAFYADALDLLGGSGPQKTRTHLVAHLLREVEGMLLQVLTPNTEEPKTLWHRAAELLRAAGQNLVDLARLVLFHVSNDVNADIKGDKPKGKSHRDKIRLCLTTLKLDGKDGAGRAWLDNAGELHALAHRRGLESPRAVDDSFREISHNFDRALDAVLDRFEAQYLSVHAQIDELIRKAAPSNADIKQLRQHLPNNQLTRLYFFKELPHPGWLQPLAKAGLLSDIPAIIADEVAGMVSIPPWPAGEYLARMAGLKDPKVARQIAELVQRLPATENTRVHETIADIAIALPESEALKLVELIGGSLHSRFLNVVLEKAGQLAAKLHVAGFRQEAMALLRRVLSPTTLVKNSEHARNSHEGYEYSQVLKNTVPTFSADQPFDTLVMLCDVLSEAVAAGADILRISAGSFVWRRSIAGPSPGHAYEILDLLVDAIRDLANGVAASSPDHLREVIQLLEARTDGVFGRIALYVLAGHAASAPDLVEARVLRKDLFDSWERQREYVGLLNASIQIVSSRVRDQVLSWIEAGPNRGDYGPEASEHWAEIQQSWRRARLKRLRGKMPMDWEEKLEALDALVPADGDLDEDTGAQWVGDRSPKTKDELRALSVPEIAKFLREWRPKPGWREPQATGAGQVLQALVSEDPTRFAEEAREFIDLEPTFVRSVIAGLDEAARQSRVFQWPAVLDLCEWTAARPVEDEPERRNWDVDPGWGRSRQAVASLVQVGLDAKAGPIPIGLREQVWRIVEQLTWDPDPSVERDSSTDLDAFDLAINTVRGTAMLAVVRYGVWVKRTIGETAGIDSIPELAKNIDEHLDPGRESSPAIWAVLGQAYPVLQWLDRRWAASKAPLIFPSEPPLSRLWQAAWSAYLHFQSPYIDVFPVLRPVYTRAVAALVSSETEKVNSDSTEVRLGWHLLTFYWRGLDGAKELVWRFFERAGIGLRTAALEFVGRSLANTEESIPDDVADRLRSLWKWRFEQATRQSTLGELQAFGWWFASGRCDVEWAGQQALAVLRLGVCLEPDDYVIKELKETVASHPLTAARILGGVVDNLKDHWGLYGWRGDAKGILAAVLDSNDMTAVAQATEVINKLAARGHLEFRKLLNRGGGPL